MTTRQFNNLNIKIAKKLGWKNFRMENTPEPMNTRRMCAVAPGNIRRQFVPHFTTNLAYAMQIVEWANEHGYGFAFNKDPKNSYSARFYPMKGPIINCDYVSGELPSLAICKALFKNIK